MIFLLGVILGFLIAIFLLILSIYFHIDILKQTRNVIPKTYLESLHEKGAIILPNELREEIERIAEDADKKNKDVPLEEIV